MISRLALAIFFVVAGVNHFIFPQTYAAMIPDWLPGAGAAVFWSGLAEVVGGFGVLIPRLRRVAGWGLIALLIAVFPANVDAAFNGMELFGGPVPTWVLWVRLPVQALFVWWVWLVCLRGTVQSKTNPSSVRRTR
ncbi:MAG: DoxX family membrane protein [Chthoniobacterales bacterium]